MSKKNVDETAADEKVRPRELQTVLARGISVLVTRVENRGMAFVRRTAAGDRPSRRRVVSVKEREEEVAEQVAEKTDSEQVVSDATAQAIVQTPMAATTPTSANPPRQVGGEWTGVEIRGPRLGCGPIPRCAGLRFGCDNGDAG